MLVRPRDVAVGILGAFVVLAGPAPGDVTSLFEHPPPPCLQSRGCGRTNSWWDRPVLVARAAEPAAPPHAIHPTPATRR